MRLSYTRRFPGTKGIRWFNLAVLTLTPLVACYGLWSMKMKTETGIFAGIYYLFSMLGEKESSILIAHALMYDAPGITAGWSFCEFTWFLFLCP